MTLVSNASLDLFPENKLSSFRTRLPFVHNFADGDWTVGLTEITYTKSWFNLQSTHHVTPAYLEDGSVVKDLKQAAKSKISAGYYSTPSDLLSHINEVIGKWAKPKTVLELPVLELKSNRKVGYKTLGKQKTGSIEREFGLKFDVDLQETLGIKDNRPPHLDQGMTSLFIYSDIVKPQVVGDSLHPLLRTVGVDSEVPFGQNVTEIFDEPYYLPLSQNVFQEITIDIRTDSGIAPSFNFGRVTVTLHFRQ